MHVCAAVGQGAGALHLAAAAGHKKCVRALLRANVAVDSQNRAGLTALHLALAGRHEETAQYLIDKVDIMYIYEFLYKYVSIYVYVCLHII